MSDPMPTPDQSSPLSWRDVYRAVNDSKTDIIAALTAAVAPLTEQAADHETRLRQIEGAVAPLAQQTASDRERLAAVEVVSRANEKAIDRFLNRENGVFSTLGVGKTFVLMIAAVASPIISLFVMLTQ